MIGKTLADRYELLEKIGEGGMARVYKGRDRLLRRTVAVKVLKDQMTGDADFVRRFRREAQSAAGLSHPHIVNIYDVGEEEDIYYIVMEYVDGANLKEYIREKGRLSPQEAVGIARQITEALVTAHSAGVIHRDIKPQNILFSKEGQVKVADFGIAIAPDGSTLTCGDEIIGSVHYFSPEQAKGNLAGKQSDLYSLGVILYEMITGQVPFSGESPVSVAMKHVQEQIKPPRTLVPDIPEPLERIILKSVQKDPALRYQDAKSFLDDLTLYQHKGAARAIVQIVSSGDEDTIVMKPVSAGPDPKKKWLVPLIIILFLSISLTVGLIVFRDMIFIPEVTIPEVRELSHNDAVEVLREHGLQVSSNVHYVYDDVIPKGHVVKSDPFQGRQVRRNRTIDLYVSMGPEDLLAPELIGKTEAEARILVRELELNLSVQREYNEEVTEGLIYRQVPGDGFRLARGDEIVIYVSMGKRPFTIGNLVGYSRDNAISYLEENGLRARERSEESNQPKGIVIAQIPAAGETVQTGQTVDIVISSGPGDGGGQENNEDD